MKHIAYGAGRSFTLWKNGLAAMGQVRGLKRRMLYGLVLNFILYILVASGTLFLYYKYIHTFLLSWALSNPVAWLATLYTVVLYVAMLLTVLVVLFFSLRFSFRLMEFWLEDLAERVVCHLRGEPAAPSTFKEMLHGLALSLLETLQDLALAAAMLLLGFIPVLGAIIVFLGGSYMMGQTLMRPYLSVLRDRREQADVGQHQIRSSIGMGWATMVFAVIPIFGWFFLPLALIVQVVGLAWEQEHKEKLQKGSN